MAFNKGKSGNPKGRPKGAKGRASGALIDRVRLLIEANFDTLQKDLDALPPAERVRAIIKLLDYVLPKRSNIDLTGQIENRPQILTQRQAIEYLQRLDAEC